MIGQWMIQNKRRARRERVQTVFNVHSFCVVALK